MEYPEFVVKTLEINKIIREEQYFIKLEYKHDGINYGVAIRKNAKVTPQDLTSLLKFYTKYLNHYPEELKINDSF